MIGNPIIQRELVGMLRTRKALVLQVGLAAVLGLLVVLRWPADSQVNLSGEQSQQVLRLFGYGLMIGLIFLAPVFPASTVVREKQSGTLALLLNSPLSPWAIVLGKLLGVLGFVLLLLIMSLPAAAACYTMGGIDLTGQLLLAYAILALVAIQYATLGLYISTRAATTDGALRMTYAGVLALAVLPLGPQQFLQGQGGSLGAAVDWIRCISPISAMMEALGHGGVGSEGLMGVAHVAGRYALLALITIILFLLLTARRLNQRMLDTPRSEGAITDEQSTGVKAYRRIMYLWFFDPQRRTGMIGPMTNPVMVKEFRSSKFGRSHWMMRLMGLCLIVSLGLMLAATRGSVQWGVEKLGGIMVVLQVALVVLLTPSLASGLISTERESGGWQLLQMTPLSAGAILRGKLLSVIRTLTLLLVATLPGYAILLLINKDYLAQVVQVIITLLLTAAFALSLSAAVSSLCRRTATATAWSYSILLLLCGGTMLVWLGRNAPFTPQTVEKVLRVNPLAAALSAIHAPGFVEYHLLPQNWWVMGAACIASLMVLAVQTWRLTRPR